MYRRVRAVTGGDRWNLCTSPTNVYYQNLIIETIIFTYNEGCSGVEVYKVWLFWLIEGAVILKFGYKLHFWAVWVWRRKWYRRNATYCDNWRRETNTKHKLKHGRLRRRPSNPRLLQRVRLAHLRCKPQNMTSLVCHCTECTRTQYAPVRYGQGRMGNCKVTGILERPAPA